MSTNMKKLETLEVRAKRELNSAVSDAQVADYNLQQLMLTGKLIALAKEGLEEAVKFEDFAGIETFSNVWKTIQQNMPVALRGIEVCLEEDE